MKTKQLIAGAAAAFALVAVQAFAQQAPEHRGPTSDVDSTAGAKHKDTSKAPQRKGSGAKTPEHRGPMSDTDSVAGQKHRDTSKAPARKGSGAKPQEHRGPMSDTDSAAGQKHRDK